MFEAVFRFLKASCNPRVHFCSLVLACLLLRVCCDHQAALSCFAGASTSVPPAGFGGRARVLCWGSEVQGSGPVLYRYMSQLGRARMHRQRKFYSRKAKSDPACETSLQNSGLMLLVLTKSHQKIDSILILVFILLAAASCHSHWDSFAKSQGCT